MAPIKFEKNIQDKLERRTIQSSENAWHRLSDELDAHASKTNKRMDWWIGIAASLVGVLLITTYSLKTPDSETILPTVVETPTIRSGEMEIEQSESIENVKVKAILKTDIISEANLTVPNQSETKKQYSLNKSSNLNAMKQDVAKMSLENSQTKNEIPKNSKLIINDRNIHESLVENTQMESNNSAIKDSEIEFLLETAQKELLTNTINTERKTKVDASTLLEDVETDLDESFRDKIFNTIVSGYNTVVTAVTDRND
jgi:hypothetical protein